MIIQHLAVRSVLCCLTLLVALPRTLWAETPQTESNVVVLGADIWCPYNCDPGLPQKGIMIEIAERAFARLGKTVTYKVMPWSQALEDAAKGKISGVMGATREEAPTLLFPHEPFINSSACFVTRKGSTWRWGGRDSLAKVRVGAVKDYNYGAEFDHYVKEHQNEPERVQFATGDRATHVNLDKLLTAKIDVFVEDGFVLDYMLANRLSRNTIIIAGSLPPLDVSIALAPQLEGNKELLDALDTELRELKKSGELMKILRNYKIKDVDPCN